MDRRPDEDAVELATSSDATGPADDAAPPWPGRAARSCVVIARSRAAIAFAVGGRDDSQQVVVGRATLAVRAALDATMESGGYEIRFETESTGTSGRDRRPSTATGRSTCGRTRSATVANVSRTRSDHRAHRRRQHLGARRCGDYGLAGRRDRGCRASRCRGSRASSRARSAQGPGAVSMLNLASPTGYLALASPTVTCGRERDRDRRRRAGHVLRRPRSTCAELADLPDLGAEQRRTIDDAAAALDAPGDGTDVRIAIDAGRATSRRRSRRRSSATAPGSARTPWCPTSGASAGSRCPRVASAPAPHRAARACAARSACPRRRDRRAGHHHDVDARDDDVRSGASARRRPRPDDAAAATSPHVAIVTPRLRQRSRATRALGRL